MSNLIESNRLIMPLPIDPEHEGNKTLSIHCDAVVLYGLLKNSCGAVNCLIFIPHWIVDEQAIIYKRRQIECLQLQSLERFDEEIELDDQPIAHVGLHMSLKKAGNGKIENKRVKFLFRLDYFNEKIARQLLESEGFTFN